MIASTQWQLAHQAAERYQSILTPAILGPFAAALVEATAPQPGEWLVDVGTGTGAAARHAALLVRPGGRVTGVDINAGMLAVARSLPPVSGALLEWREATATRLPLDDHSVDGVLCAQTLQFLPEKAAALAEMRRVVKSGGRVALSLWCELEESPYFHTLVEAIARHIGPDTAAGLRSAFALSDGDELHRLLKTAGFSQIDVRVMQLDLSLPPLAEFVPRHISATPMAVGFNRATEPVQQALIREVNEQLHRYQTNGRAQIPFKSHLVMGRK